MQGSCAAAGRTSASRPCTSKQWAPLPTDQHSSARPPPPARPPALTVIMSLLVGTRERPRRSLTSVHSRAWVASLVLTRKPPPSAARGWVGGWAGVGRSSD